MPRIVIGLVGRKGSGKGTVARMLKDKYGASLYRFSDIMRDVLDRLFIEKNRENLIQISEVLRHGFGQDLFQRVMTKQIEHDPAQLIVIDGLRRLGDLEGLETLGQFHLVNIEAPLETRFERLRARGENAGETTRTLESFTQMEHAPTEITIPDVEARAHHVIDNGGDQQALEKQVDELMSSLLSSRAK